jgi:hypothetical protein
MACILSRNSQGKIVSASTPQGQESKLFNAIHSNPFMADTETSAQVYANILTPGLEERYQNTKVGGITYDTGEPILFYQAENGKVYDSLEQAIIEGNSGQFQMGFKHYENSEFQPVGTFNTESSEQSKFILSGIKSGTISENRVLMPDGSTRFQGKGHYDITRKGTARVAKLDYAIEFGEMNLRLFGDGTFDFRAPRDRAITFDNEGNVTSIALEDIPEYINQNNPDNKAELMIQYMANEIAKNITKDEVTNSEDEKARLLDNLYYFLESMGFELSTLDKYTEKYNKRHGKDPDVIALADMADRVIAFANGEITLESLNEEVAHIAIEFFADQNSIESALANVHLTPEYRQYSEFYRTKYSKDFQGIELEDQVRREVLGKVLKSEFQKRFNPENRTEEGSFLLEKLREIWDSFIGFIRGNITNRRLQELEQLKKDIVDAVFENNSEVFDPSIQSERFFYDAMDSEGKQMENKLRNLRNELETYFSRGLGQKVPSQQELEKVVAGMEQIDMVRALNSMVSTSLEQVKYVEAAVAQAEKDQKSISNKDELRLRNIETVIELLNDVKLDAEKLRTADPKLRPEIQKIVNNISDLNNRVATVTPKLNNFKNQRVQTIVKDALDPVRDRLTKEEVEAVERGVDNVEKDINIAALNFGLASQSRNPVLALLAKKVKDMYVDVNIDLIARVNPELEYIRKNDLEKYQSNIVRKGTNGKASYFYRGPYNWEAFENRLQELEVEVISDLTGKPKEDIRKELETKTADEVIGNADLYSKFRRDFADRRKLETKQRFSQDYEKAKQERYSKADVSEVTKDYLSNKNRNRFERDRKYLVNGSVDNSLKTEQDKLSDIVDKQNHARAKSAYYDGEVREGLRVVKASDLTSSQRADLKLPEGYNGDVVMLAPNFTKDTLPSDSRLSLDLFNLDMVYRNETAEKTRSGKPTDTFKDKIKQIESTGQSALDWVLSNSTIAMTDAYYNSMDTNLPTYSEQVRKWANQLEAEDRDGVLSMLELLEKYQSNRKSIISVYRKPSNPMEVDPDMPEDARRKVLELDALIAELRRDISLPQEYFDQVGDIRSERTLSEDFALKAEEEGLTEYEFALKHMTAANYNNTTRFAEAITKYLNGKTSRIKPAYSDFYTNLVSENKIPPGLSDQELIDFVKTEYAKSKVASYFQRYEPRGFSEFMQQLRTMDDLSMNDIMEKNAKAMSKFPILEFVDFRPDYTWTEDINNSDMMNSDYKEGGYYMQPSDEYLDKEGFFDHYGISIEQWKALNTDDISQLEATKNKEEFELLKIAIKLREDTLENYEDSSLVNKYQRPQISRSNMEKLLQVVDPRRKGVLKEQIRDIFQNRVDEKDYGEVSNEDDLVSSGSGITRKVIPKYFQTKLENPDILTDNILSAAYTDYKESLVYRNRKEQEADITALLWKLSDQKYRTQGDKRSRISIGKKGQVSNYFKKGEEYVNFNLYGIKQSRRLEVNINGNTVDLTRVINAIQGWTRFSNLAYNFIVDATSLTTGLLVNVSDRMSKQFYHNSSANRASVLSTEVFKYIAEEGKIGKDSPMNHLLELFGVESVDERLANSGMGRATRLLSDSPYVIAKVSNMGIKPRVLMANIVDTRLINGRWFSYPDYFRYRKNQDKTVKTSVIEAEFRKFDKNSVYDYLKISKQGIEPNELFKAEFGDNYKAEFKRLIKDISSKTEVMVQITDTVISQTDRTRAQRDVLTNTLMMHKGWMPINLTKRWKQRHFDFATGQMEEGHYQTLFNLVGDIVKSKSYKNIGQVREMWSDLSQDQKSNMLRVMVETGMLIGIVLLGLAVFSGDDKDDSALEDVLQYVLLRTSSEFNSSTIFGQTKSVIDVAKSPITSISMLEQFEPVTLVSNLAGGFWDGEVWKKAAKKASPLKRLDQWSDIRRATNSYFYFNRNTIPFHHPIRAENARIKAEREQLKREAQERSYMNTKIN